MQFRNRKFSFTSEKSPSWDFTTESAYSFKYHPFGAKGEMSGNMQTNTIAGQATTSYISGMLTTVRLATHQNLLTLLRASKHLKFVSSDGTCDHVNKI